jgi:hypothetical protein
LKYFGDKGDEYKIYFLVLKMAILPFTNKAILRICAVDLIFLILDL